MGGPSAGSRSPPQHHPRPLLCVQPGHPPGSAGQGPLTPTPFLRIGLGQAFLAPTPEIEARKANTDRQTHVGRESVCTAEGTIEKMRSAAPKGKKCLQLVYLIRS